MTCLSKGLMNFIAVPSSTFATFSRYKTASFNTSSGEYCRGRTFETGLRLEQRALQFGGVGEVRQRRRRVRVLALRHHERGNSPDILRLLQEDAGAVVDELLQVSNAAEIQPPAQEIRN